LLLLSNEPKTSEKRKGLIISSQAIQKNIFIDMRIEG